MEKVIIKEPGKSPEVLEVNTIGLNFLQHKVDGLIDVVRMDNKIDMIINDEMLFIEAEANFRYINKHGHVLDIFGTVVFASYDEEGNSVSLSDEQIQILFKMFN